MFVMSPSRKAASMAIAKVLVRFPHARLESWYGEVCDGSADYWRNAGLCVEAAYVAAGRNREKQLDNRRVVENILTEAKDVAWQW